ncbi:MAG: hypothetical protein OEV99_06070 [Nitrospira sp.]|nr:hypothetical protein [Nitrospira sp.]MDH4369395.1 hypothetical protein [Nitrospira sp.]MDH5497603.1 hypothetical protein [Nitrospira sp.]
MNASPVLSSIATVLLMGCALEQEVSRTPRTAVEQVLLTQAVEQALVNLTVQLPEGVNVDVDATGLESGRSQLRMTNADRGAIDHPSRDILYVRDIVAAELGRRGYRVSARDTESPYLVRVMAESFGTMQGSIFVGMPPVQSVLIPFSLPELTLYKRQNQSGYARLHLDLYDNRTGEFLGSTPKLVGRAFYNQYTVLIFATWNHTDITAPPVAGR